MRRPCLLTFLVILLISEFASTAIPKARPGGTRATGVFFPDGACVHGAGITIRDEEALYEEALDPDMGKGSIVPHTRMVSVDWTHYHNYTEIVTILHDLNETYPDIVDVFSIGKSWQNRSIYCIRLTRENASYAKPKVLFVGYHHAREPISAELPLYFALYAAENYGVNETITHILDFCEIYIIVALNVDGFDAVRLNEWQRKNARPFDEDEDGLFDEDPPDDEDGDGYIEDLWLVQDEQWDFVGWEGIDDDIDGQLNEDWVGGVDLNRNYGYQWNATCDSGSPYTWAEDYRGPSMFSEPETQALRDFALNHSFKYAVSFHSGAENIVYPWGYTNQPSPDDQVFRQVAANLSALVGAPYEQSGAWYTTSGVWDDWMYGNRSALAFTCEIFGNDSAWQYEPGPSPDTWWEKGIFQAFNPEPTQIESTVLRWMPTFAYICNVTIHEFWRMVPSEFATIQAAVNATSWGGGVFVASGTYYEHVVLNKTLQLVGESPEDTIIDGSAAGTVINVTADNTIVKGFTIGNSDLNGILAVGRSNVTIQDNIIVNSYLGIYLESSSNNDISGNNVTANSQYGVALDSSSNNSISGNTFTNDGLHVENSYQNSVENNTVNGRPLVYLEGVSNYTVVDAGQVVLIRCENIRVEGLNLSRTDTGIELWETSNSTISGNNIIANSGDGISLYSSSNNSISWNNITANSVYSGVGGVSLYSSSCNNMVCGNNIANNWGGIWFDSSSNYNGISGNNITNNEVGVNLDSSLNNSISGNNIANNWDGICLDSSLNNSISWNNITANDGNGISLYSSSNNSISGNDITANKLYGILLCFSSNYNSVSGNNITANDEAGIWLYSSSRYNSISGNNVTNSGYGIILSSFSSINGISGNNVTNNSYGIVLDYSSYNKIPHNNFVNNYIQVYSSGSPNVWDDGYPSGGNYWSSYTGSDLYLGEYQDEPGSDGIGDTQYSIGVGNADRYPLMQPWTPPDVATTDLMASKSFVGQGYTLRLNGTFLNQGNKVEGFNVSFYANSTAIVSQSVVLVTGDSTVISFVWNTTGFSYGNYTVSAYAWPAQGETDLSDNNFEGGTVLVTIPGDADGDFRVKPMDLNALLVAYGSPSNPERPYNPNCDIDDDGKIGPNDLNILLNHYGQHYP